MALRGLVLPLALAVGLGAPWQARAAPPPLEAFGQMPTIEQVTLSQQAPQLAAALRASGKQVETVRIDTDDWDLRTAATRTGLLNAAVPFVEKYDPSGAP